MGAKPFSSYRFQDKHLQAKTDRKRAGFAGDSAGLGRRQPAFFPRRRPAPAATAARYRTRTASPAGCR
jgi:hypothetical protein